MIDGLKFKIPAAELATHCFARADYHKGRANEKHAELPGLREALAKVEAVTGAVVNPQSLAHMNKSTAYRMDTDQPVEALENDIKEHRNKALVFEFFGKHLFDEDYTLQEADLIRLEILKR